MLDIKLLRENPETLRKKLLSKMADADIDTPLALDVKLRGLKKETEELVAKKNQLSKEIGMKKGQMSAEQSQELSDLNKKLLLLEPELKQLETDFLYALSLLPNIPKDEVPVHPNKEGNVCVKTHLTKPSFDFEAKNHVELNKNLQLFDFERGAKLTGSGWVVYQGLGARLEWALINYMLETHIKNGYTQIIPPHIVKDEMMFGAGQFPKFKDQVFKLDDPDYPFYMIPTAEVALNGLHAQEVVDESTLPFRYASYTPCFRREAGAAGSGERGLIRIHQFNKVEMFAFTTPEDSDKQFDAMVKSAESILEGLNIHYRSMLLSTGDMSYGSAKTIDIEVWLPGQNRYYEVSSVSNCTDFQARRSNIRCRKKEDKPRFVHTLNGSGLATSRLMVALLENNQRKDGSVEIPEALRPYLGGIKEIIQK